MNTSQLLSLSLLVACLSGTSFVSAKTYYKWVDDSGVTHYSEQKPYDKPSEEVIIKGGRQATTNTNNSPPPQQAPKTSATQTPAEVKAPTKDAKRCEDARTNLETLKNHARVRVEDANGEMRYMDEKEKAEKLKEMQKIVTEAC